MANLSFKTLEVWNIERAGNTKSVELIAIFNVDRIENRLKYSLFDSQNNLISSLVFPRDYRKGEAVYPKFFETATPDGIVTMTAHLVDGSDHRISDIVAQTLYLKKAQPASGIGQRALESPTFNLPEFPEDTSLSESSGDHGHTRTNPDVVPVWYTDSNAWRSFRIDRIKEFKTGSTL